jgi:hypothetical protein
MNNCAWCGDKPDANGSHSICDEHSEQLFVNHYQNKFDAVPSYVERFSQDREASEQEVQYVLGRKGHLHQEEVRCEYLSGIDHHTATHGCYLRFA